MRYVYADESIFSSPRPCIGSGMLISDASISTELIAQAMNSLINDEDRFDEPAKTMDDRTIARGFFHASEDSKNAHSHLCDRINSIKNAEFICTFFDKDSLSINERNDPYLYRQSMLLSSIKATHTTTETVKVYVENRKDITINSLSELLRKLEEYSLQNIYDLPYDSYYFPKVDFEIVNKNNPGIQCADFLLWTVNRFINGEKKWFYRINASIRKGFTARNGGFGGQDVEFGAGLDYPDIYYTIHDFPVDPDSEVNKQLYVKFYLHAAEVIEYYLRHSEPHFEHLLKEVEEAVNNKKNLADIDYFDKISASYLKLFDMVPIINAGTSNSDKKLLLLSKKYMSLLLRKDLLHGVRTRIWLEKIRRDFIQNHPDLLDFQ